jgi:hypothetical protein
MSDIKIKDYGTGEEPEDQTWTTAQLQEDFVVLTFLAPNVTVRRKSDGVIGTLQFQHSPRIYWGFKERS